MPERHQLTAVSSLIGPEARRLPLGMSLIGINDRLRRCPHRPNVAAALGTDQEYRLWRWLVSPARWPRQAARPLATSAIAGIHPQQCRPAAAPVGLGRSARSATRSSRRFSAENPRRYVRALAPPGGDPRLVRRVRSPLAPHLAEYRAAVAGLDGVHLSGAPMLRSNWPSRTTPARCRAVRGDPPRLRLALAALGRLPRLKQGPSIISTTLRASW